MLMTFSSRGEVVPVTLISSRRDSLNLGPVYLAMTTSQFLRLNLPDKFLGCGFDGGAQAFFTVDAT